MANNSSAIRLHFDGASAIDHGNRWVTTRPVSKGNKERIKNHAALLDIVTSKPQGPVLKEENFYGKRANRKLRNSNAYLYAEPPKMMLRKRSVQQPPIDHGLNSENQPGGTGSVVDLSARSGRENSGGHKYFYEFKHASIAQPVRT